MPQALTPTGAVGEVRRGQASALIASSELLERLRWRALVEAHFPAIIGKLPKRSAIGVAL